MIIDTPDDVTASVLAELARAEDPRWRELASAAVRHLHAFVREVGLTELEFQRLCGVVARLGQATTASHNEVVLAAGATGVSALVCLLNNGRGGRLPSTANLMGPFWRDGAPWVEPGGSIVRGPTPGEPLFVQGRVVDLDGAPVAEAEVHVWHCSGEGFYENQDPSQPDWNLRGRLRTSPDGSFAFRSVRPCGYPVPVGGPVGELLRHQGRHNFRPAHLHVLVRKPGFKTQFAQIYDGDDPHLEADVAFAVTRPLVARFERHDGPPAPTPDVTGPWHRLQHTLVVEPGDDRAPAAPIRGKADGPRPTIEVLEPR